MKFGSITTGIVSDGLVFNVDAANRASYPAQRTFAIAESGSCYNTLDLSQSGSFISDPTFITQPVSASCWQFDGIDDYIRATRAEGTIAWNAAVLATYNIWVKINDTSPANIPIFCGDGNRGLGRDSNQFMVLNDKLAWILDSSTSPSSKCYIATEDIDGSGAAPNLLDGNWHNLVIYNPVTGDSTRADIANAKIYLDTIKLTNTTINEGSHSIRGGSDGVICLGLGNAGGNTSQLYLIGNIGCIQYYNRELSANEVLHNYNALKGRFI